MKKIILGGLLGGIVLFFWGFLSHTVIPWYAVTSKHFEDESAVLSAMKDNASEPGIYVVPNPYIYEHLPEEEAVAKSQEVWKGMFTEFNAWAVVLPSGYGAQGPTMGLGLLQMILAAAFLSWLVLRVGPKAYKCRVGFIVMVAAFGAFTTYVPGWIWLGMPADYMLVQVADFMIGWTLTGLVVAKFAAPDEAAVQG